VDVGLEVPNHVKFPVCFYLFFYSYLWVCFRLKRLLFLVRDFLRFWVESGVNILCGWAQVSLVLFSLVKPPPYKPNKWYQSRWLKPA